MLVDSRYATFIEVAEATAEDTLDAVEVEPAETEPVAADEPETTLPAKSANKGEWEDVAASLGIDTADMNKDEVIEAVTEAVG